MKDDNLQFLIDEFSRVDFDLAEVTARQKFLSNRRIDLGSQIHGAERGQNTPYRHYQAANGGIVVIGNRRYVGESYPVQYVIRPGDLKK